ncbi:MAG TPA: WhiB family transcriptional regulator [Acidimicrobiales bacterium]|nr:WhiB family transcriptional regulator [Acidimicrobiales bacterium]
MYAIDENQELEAKQPLAQPAAWWAKARCNDGAATLTSLFFSEDLIDIARAKAICSKCPVREPCLAEALARQEPFGVWGGQLLQNGRIVLQKRKRGRPPKHPRPEIVVDEVPLPPFIRTA